jgi:hypothetical protein
LNLANDRGALTGISSGRVLLTWIGNVNEMVWDTVLRICRNFVCSDVEASIDGGRVTADNFAAVADSQMKREAAFSRSRRTEDGKEGQAQV